MTTIRPAENAMLHSHVTSARIRRSTMNLQNATIPRRLRSDAVQLRTLEADDRDSLFAIYSHAESASLDDWEPMTSVDEADALVRSAQIDFDNRNVFRYGITTPDGSRLVGCCGLFGFDETNSKCMVYYQVHHDERGHGYATGAVGLLLEVAFRALVANRVEAYVTPGNDPSIRVLEKCGFNREGLLREMEFYKGRFWDGILMAILRSDTL